MAEKLEFREKLGGILQLCSSRGNVIDKAEVEDYFAEDGLSKEQMELVFDYLLSQKIIVKGYVKAGGSVTAAGEQAVQHVFGSEEEQYLRAYELDLEQMPEDDPLAKILPRIVQMAKEMYQPEIFLGDLIQEGNMGLMLAMQQGEADEEELLMMARESMQALLESQSEMKMKDRKMVSRVNDLDAQIKKLTEEMGRKVSVDELVEFLDISEEEIADVLKLAGEELPE